MNQFELYKKITYGFIGFLLFMGSFFIVSPGEVGVKFNKFTGDTTSHSQGINFKLPFIDGVSKFDVKTQRVDMAAEGASKDLQAVKLDISLNYHLDYEKVNDLYIKVGRDFDKKIIEPAIAESIKAASSQFPAEQIITNRHDLKKIIEEMLSKRLVSYNIILEALSISDIDFSPEFNKVVEDKQIEEQKIKTAEYQRRQAEEYKKKTILEAEANAQAQRLMRETVTENIVQLEWIKKWNGQLPTTILGDKSSVLMGNMK